MSNGLKYGGGNQSSFWPQIIAAMKAMGSPFRASYKGGQNLANTMFGQGQKEWRTPMAPGEDTQYTPPDTQPDTQYTGKEVYSPLHPQQPQDLLGAEIEKSGTNIFGVPKSQYADQEWPDLGIKDWFKDKTGEALEHPMMPFGQAIKSSPGITKKRIEDFLTTPIGEQIDAYKQGQTSDTLKRQTDAANVTNQSLLDMGYSQDKINRDMHKDPSMQYMTPGFTSQADADEQELEQFISGTAPGDLPPNDFDFGGMDEGYGQSDMPYGLSFPPPDEFGESPSPAGDYPDEFGETPVGVSDKDVYGLPWDEPNVVPKELNTIPGQFVNNRMEAGVYTPPSGQLTIPDNLMKNQAIQSQSQDLFMGGAGGGNPLDDVLQQINSRGPVEREGPPMAPYNEFEDFDATPYAEPVEKWNPFEDMGGSSSGFDSDSLMSAIMQKESGGATEKMMADSLASEGAVGPLQQRDIFYKDVTGRMGFPEYDRNNPEEAKAAGAHYIKYLMEEKGLGLPEALAAYNAGQTGARKGRGKKYAESILDTMKTKFGGKSSNEFEDFDMLEALSR